MLKRTMGYEVTTSHSMRAISALSQFGLLEEEGSAAARKLKLSELGLNIVLRKESDHERVGLLRKAAVKPVIYSQMLEMWRDDLPPDDTISNYLLFTKNFNPAVVPGVLRDFKATYQFARLSWSGARATGNRDQALTDTATTTEPENASVRADAGAVAPAAPEQSPAPPHAVRRYHLPLPYGRQAVIEVPADATDVDVDFIAKYIALMRDVLATGAESAPERSE